jgi:hypothetical protein
MEKITFTSTEQLVAAITMGEAVVERFELHRPATPKAGGGLEQLAANASIMVVIVDLANGARKKGLWTGQVAWDLHFTLNKLDYSGANKSLHRRILDRMVLDGKCGGGAFSGSAE